MLNCVNLMGRLVSDPEFRTTANGKAVTNFSIAVERDYKTEDGKVSDFISCNAWGNTAEFISKYFSKGQMIAIQGSLQTRSYTDKNGNNRNVVYVLTSHAYGCGKSVSVSDGKDEPVSFNKADSGAELASNYDDTFVIDDDDLPF